MTKRWSSVRSDLVSTKRSASKRERADAKRSEDVRPEGIPCEGCAGLGWIRPLFRRGRSFDERVGTTCPICSGTGIEPPLHPDTQARRDGK